MNSLSGALVILCAGLLDWFFGEPPGHLHPVRAIGGLIGWFEERMRPRWSERAAGAVLVVAVLVVAGSAAWVVYGVAGILPDILQVAVTAGLASTFLAQRSLFNAALRVKDTLIEGELTKARDAVGHIVGRDTEEMTSEDVIRAAVESTAENTVDGVTAPLFYLAVGGLPAMILYKAINTMDSMLGYTNDKYRFFGWAAAKLDDAANWLPARIAAFLWPLAAWLVNLDPGGALRIMLRDGRKHPSPNAGIAESAVAGALGIQLGGPSYQGGKLRCRSRLGDSEQKPMAEHIAGAVFLSQMTCILSTLLFSLFTYFLG